MVVQFGQLCRLLQLSRARLRQLVVQGCPHRVWGHRRMFDPVAVAMWLRAKNIPANPEPSTAVVSTRREAAAAFGVSTRTITRWLARGCPGRCGQRGRKNGRFAISEIDEWLKKNTTTITSNRKDAR